MKDCAAMKLKLLEVEKPEGLRVLLLVHQQPRIVNQLLEILGKKPIRTHVQKKLKEHVMLCAQKVACK